MKALVKREAAKGIWMEEVPVPQPRPTCRNSSSISALSGIATSCAAVSSAIASGIGITMRAGATKYSAHVPRPDAAATRWPTASPSPPAPSASTPPSPSLPPIAGRAGSSPYCPPTVTHSWVVTGPTRAERIHHAQPLAAADRGQRRLVAVLAAHGQQVVVVDRCQLHADPHFAGGGLGQRTVAGDKHVGRIAELVVDGATHVGLRQSRRHPSYTPWPVRASPTPLSGAHYRFHKPRRMGTR